MANYYLWTIGCQMNKAESQRLEASIQSAGYQRVIKPQEADLVVLNTCVVRGNAEQRVIGELEHLRGLKNRFPQMTIVVTGCFVPLNSSEFENHFPQVDACFPAGNLDSLVEWLCNREVGSTHVFSSPELPLIHPSISTFVPIMQGCDNFCTYCIVPYRRGRECSRPVEEIVCEVEHLVNEGTKEVILLGQNVNSYGRGLPGNPDLAGLLRELNEVEGLKRIRFLTSHPRDVDEDFIGTVAGMKKVCNWISVPVQSGDDRVLEAMGRGYTSMQYCNLVEALRRRIPEISLSTDIIVGFPGETRHEFEHTVELLSDIRFDTVHIAAYSPREGTVAARNLHDDIPSHEKHLS